VGDSVLILEDDSLATIGQQLFTNETFDGNGRTCATCHDAGVAFALTPQGVESRFNDDPLDPLFIAENDPVLAELENPCLMRQGDQRALILENIDGFANDPVFRGSPHLLNIALTAPYGLSGGIPDLRAFTVGAVIQHFTQTLARGATDFRLPTDPEIDALEAFMNSITFPSDGNLDLDRMIAFDVAQNGSDPVQIQRGRDVFFGPDAQCSACHSGPTLSHADGSLGTGTGNLEFDTGVVNRPANFDDGCIGGPGDPTLPLPPEAGTDRTFSTAPLVGVARTGPFFHDNSASTLIEAVQFYDTTHFRHSPAEALLPSELFLPLNDSRAIAAFLEAISVDPAIECSDSLDNDGDGLADFPGDPGCEDANDGSERSAALICDNGEDDDEDGLTDLDDPSCEDSTDPSERDCFCVPSRVTPAGNLASLKNVATGAKGSSVVRNVIVQLDAEPVTIASCPKGATSNPVDVNLLISDDDGNVIVDRTKGGFVCIGQVNVFAKFGVSFERPKNCKDSATPAANAALGDLLVTVTTDDGSLNVTRRINCKRRNRDVESG
jgi:cytochrome c peroxidase